MNTLTRTLAFTLVVSLLSGCAAINPKSYHPPTQKKSIVLTQEMRWSRGFGHYDFRFPAGVYPAILDDGKGIYYQTPADAILSPKTRNEKNDGFFISYDHSKAYSYIWPKGAAGTGLIGVVAVTAAGGGSVPVPAFTIPEDWRTRIRFNP